MRSEPGGPSSGDLYPELARSQRDFEAAEREIRELAEGLSDTQFNWRPGLGRWSISECLEHLNSGHLALPRLERKIAEGRALGMFGSGPFRHGWLGNLYVRFAEPPPRIRVRSPKRYAPKPELPLSDVLPRLLKLQQELISCVHAANGLDLGQIRMSSPISRRFKMSLGQWFSFLAAHQRRHLWQAWHVRRHTQFPEPGGESRQWVAK